MPHNAPAPLEQVRVPLARQLFRSRPFIRLALRLTPRSHPFRPFAESTLDDLSEFSDLVLRPRTELVPDLAVINVRKINYYPKPRKRMKLLFAMTLSLLAMILADAIQASPVEFGISEELGMHVYDHTRKNCTIAVLPTCR